MHLALGVCIALAGCSHRSGTGAAANDGGSGPTQSLDGIWSGTDASGQPVVAMVDVAGEFHIIRADGTQYVGTSATVNGDAVSAKADRVTRAGGSEGSAYEAATVSGKVQQRQSLSLRIVPAAGARPFATETMSLQFNPIYNSPSSLAAFAGDYMDNSSGNSIKVTGSGSLFWRDSRDGCLASGAVSLIDPRYNLYFVQFSYSACQGADAELHGVEFRGLGTIDTSMQPAQANIGVAVEAGGHGYAIHMTLSRLPPRSPI